MSTEKRKILEMVSSGKINVDEAERLLSALEKDPGDAREMGGEPKPKYLRVLVEPSADNPQGDRVNVRVPLNLIRAGMKWASLIPQHAQGPVQDALKDQGLDIDLSRVKPEDLEEIIRNLNDIHVEIDGKESVRVFCE